MGLSLLDCRVGTVVDHTYEVLLGGKDRMRSEIRRGIIVRVDGENNASGGVTGLWIKFSKEGAAEKVPAAELVRFLPASSRVAKEAYRRIMGIPKVIGKVRSAPVVTRPAIVDELQLTPAKGGGPVAEEDPGIAGMPLEDTGE